MIRNKRGKVKSCMLLGGSWLAVLACLGLLWSTAAAKEVGETRPESKSRTMRVWTDDLGRSRKVPWPPRKIVAMGGSRSPVETICALGKVELIKARADWNTWPPVLAKIPHIGRNPQINLEVLLRCKPDFIIATSQFRQNLDRIESMGLPVLVFETKGADDAARLVRLMGLLLDCQERAGELAEYINRYLILLDTRIKGVGFAQKPKVFMGRGRQVYYPAFSKGRLCVVEMAGGRNIANNLYSQSQQVTPEWMVEQNPDYLVINPSLRAWGFQIPDKKIMQAFRDDILNRPGVSLLTPAKRNRLLLIDSRICWGLRSFIGALYLAKKLHPDLFKDIDPTAVHRDFLKRFFDLELQGAYVYP